MKRARKTVRRTSKTSDALPSSEVVALPVNCTVRHIDAVRDQLCGVRADAGNVTLDLRRMERFDTSTLQLIAAFAREQAARGTNLLICGNRPAWDEAAELLGLTATLAGRV
ncbi:MAG: STAS domain-containing protein [Steroidobacteraceae bacterium]